jgi:acetyl-CoA carboxylase biotin carboxyl carrier protein
VDLSSDDVEDILQLLDSLPFAELHLQTTRFRLSLRRTANGEWTQETSSLSPPHMLAGAEAETHAGPVNSAPAQPRLAHAASAPAGSAGAEETADGLCAVRAPLLGTFYRAPRPGAPPFVEVGSHVDADTVVGIIETMKLMNSVSAGVRGTVAEILVADAQFAAQDSALMRVREEA